MQVQKGKNIYFSTNPSLNLIFFVILTSTYYNKSNLKVKESSEQYLIEIVHLEWCECPILFYFFENTGIPRIVRFQLVWYSI